MTKLTDLFWLLFAAFLAIAAFSLAAKTVAEAVIVIRSAIHDR